MGTLLKRLSAVFAAFFICFGASTAFAQADRGGLELRAGLAVPIYAGASTDLDGASALSAVGFGVNVQVMYRWTYFGLGIEQFVSGIVATNDTFSVSPDDAGVTFYGLREIEDNAKNAGIFQKGDSVFYGGTFFVLKEYIPFGNNLITIGEGAGVTYGANKEHKKLYTTDSDLAVAIKVELGYTYFIAGLYGVGINLDYTLSMAINDGISISNAVTPMLTFDMVF